MLPLFKLPLLVLLGIIRSMSYSDMFVLSVLSKRSRETVKFLYPRIRVNMEILVSEKEFTIKIEDMQLDCVEFTNLRNHDRLMKHKVGNVKVRITKFGGPITCFWKKPRVVIPLIHTKKEYIGSLIHHFLDLFNHPITSIRFQQDAKQSSIIATMKFIGKQGIELSRLSYFNFNRTSSEVMDQILKNCGNVYKMKLNTKPPKRYIAPSPLVLKMDSLEISQHSHWLKLESVLQCKQVLIYDYVHTSTAARLNKFFETLITEDNRLEYLEFVVSRQLDFNAVVAGLSDSPIVNIPDGWKSIDVRKKDGLEMSIQHGAQRHYLIRKKLLE